MECKARQRLYGRARQVLGTLAYDGISRARRSKIFEKGGSAATCFGSRGTRFTAVALGFYRRCGLEKPSVSLIEASGQMTQDDILVF